MTPLRATVSFALDSQGNLVATVTSDDPLARSTLSTALEEFWAVDAARFDAKNLAKWKRRLRR